MMREREGDRSAEREARRRARHGFAKLAAAAGRELDERAIEDAFAEAPGPPTPETLAKIARSLGFEVGLKPIKGRRPGAIRPPYIAAPADGGPCWLVAPRHGGHLAIVDPIDGEETPLTLADLNDYAASALSMRVQLGADGERKSLWRDAIRPRIRPIGWEIGVASAAVNLLALATPLFVMAVFNRVVGQGGLDTLDVLAVGMIVVFGFDFVLRSIRSHVAAHIGARLEAAVGAEVGKKLMNLPYRTFENLQFGQTQEQVRQLDRVRAFFGGGAPLTLADIVFAGLFLIALFVIEPVIGWITAAAIPFFLLFSWLSQGRQKDLAQEAFRAQSAKTGLMAEAMTNALTVKALGLERVIEEKLDKRLAASALASFESARLRSVVSNAGLVLQHAVTLAVIYVGARLILEGESSIGALIAGAILASRTLAPMRMAIGAWRQLLSARDALARLDALVNHAPERRGELAPDASALDGAVRLEKLRFRYSADAPWLFDGVDFELEAGRITGLVGLAGAGKSTLIKLLIGLEIPESGRILYNGSDLQSLPPAAVRSRIGVVPQECQMFCATIAENIAIGAEDADRATAIAAARFVGLHAVVEALPDGYDTLVGERGFRLSAGQRQLVALARAIVRNPKILLLDEATSALDAASERVFLDNLVNASPGPTTLMITHRGTALERCDRAFVLKNGSVRPAKAVARRRRPQDGHEPGAERVKPARPFLRAVG